MARQFQSEKDGQSYFYDKVELTKFIDLSNNTDGVYKGTIFEFKLTISNINVVLFQTIKYLSSMRIKGRGIPKNILLVSLNEEIAYLFDSADFINDIEKIYTGAASRNNEKFDTQIKHETIHYDNIQGLKRLIDIIDDERYTKIHIDVFCVVGWTECFYRENLNATKIDLFNELREPNYFKDFIYPWNGEETDFKYIMDCLNDRMYKKELGAFYTPPAYCKKATELVRKAIAQVPKGNNYIILDRCAGTGNLQEFLTDKNVADITIEELSKYLSDDIKFKYLQNKADIISTFYIDKKFDKITMAELEKYETGLSIYDYLFDNELSHCVVNTFELKEWIVLNERIGDKVKMIIPPPIEVKNTDSLVNGGDALSEIFITGTTTGEIQGTLWQPTLEYIESINELNSYIKDPKTNIIIFENPPYRNDTADYKDTKIKKDKKKQSYILQQYKEKKENKNSRDYDLSILFIWSAKEYYMKKLNDALIVFSPVKYFKSVGLDKGLTFEEGYMFNRQHFHASPSSISLMHWSNKQPIQEQTDFILPAYDIGQSHLIYITKAIAKYIDLDIVIKKCYTYTSTIWYENNIEEKKDIAYLDAKGFGIGNLTFALTNNKETSPYKRGFYLKENCYYEKLPLFCAKLYPQKNWYEKDIYFTTADGGDAYTKDAEFLKACFIFTCLSQRNHCLTFIDEDGQFYKNELCFDSNTIATNKLKELKLTETEKELLSTSEEILSEGKKTENYNPNLFYGTYQIDKELNTYYKPEKSKTRIYNYPELNTKIIALKQKLAGYYEEIIQPKLFEYELLK